MNAPCERSASVVLWEIIRQKVGGGRYFFCNEPERGEPVTAGAAYPIQGKWV